MDDDRKATEGEAGGLFIKDRSKPDPGPVEWIPPATAAPRFGCDPVLLSFAWRHTSPRPPGSALSLAANLSRDFLL